MHHRAECECEGFDVQHDQPTVVPQVNQGAQTGDTLPCPKSPALDLTPDVRGNVIQKGDEGCYQSGSTTLYVVPPVPPKVDLLPIQVAGSSAGVSHASTTFPVLESSRCIELDSSALLEHTVPTL